MDQSKVDTNGSTARRMASVSQMISTSVDAGSNATDALTEAKVLSLHQTCYENGSEPTMMIVKPADASIVAGFATATGRNREIDAKTLTNVIEVILTPLTHQAEYKLFELSGKPKSQDMVISIQAA